MKLYRLYSGDDGRSHLAQLDTSAAGKLFDITHDATGLLLKKIFRNTFWGFIEHPGVAGLSPSREVLISVSGTARARRSSPETHSSPRI